MTAVGAVRMAVVWCPDWPVVASGVPLDEPVAVVVANRVVASSPAARHSGVAAGQRRRDAQARCPDLAVLERDVDREARLFEPVAVALEALTPRIEVTGPGLLGFPTRGPSRFFGGDDALADRVLAEVEPVLARRGQARVAIADGVFAARLAARSVDAASGPMVLAPGGSAAFLAGFPVDALELPSLTDVLHRLGLRTLGAFAELPAADVVGRFGREGQVAHRLASGQDEFPPDLRRPAPDLAVTWEFEPPADTTDRCAFVAKALADEVHEHLLAEGLACTRIAIETESEAGQVHVRLWRHEGTLSAAAIAERTRWQLDGWLRQGRTGPQGAIVRLTLVPDEVVPATGRQLRFWGGRNERADDVTRVVARLQAMLGPEAVSVPESRGGIGPGERIELVPAAAVDLGEDRPAAAPAWVTEPWPGRVPAPAPARIDPDPRPVDLVDHGGQSVGVTGRGELTTRPVRLIEGGSTSAAPGLGGVGDRLVTGWAGPWPADQRWWDPVGHRRRARLQVVLDDGSAHLVVIEHGTWAIEASYW